MRIDIFWLAPYIGPSNKVHGKPKGKLSITLPADWTPIGINTGGERVQAFAGILDGGGHTLNYTKVSRPLFNYVSDAYIHDLKIFGEEINGCGLINDSFVDYGADNNYWTG